MLNVPSPAVAFVGRHNSGKTTIIVKAIRELVARGWDVGSVKHHSHVGFEIDYPGKDSYRHREAGASETVIACPGQMARIKTIEGELECADIVRDMKGHDIVIVEGYRKSGLPTIEVMRAGNAADERVAEVFAEGARRGWKLGTDFVQFGKGEQPPASDEEARERLEEAARQLVSAPRRWADLGVCNGRHFIETLSFGLDAAIALDTIERRKRTGAAGVTLYMQSGFDQLRNHLAYHEMEAWFDGLGAASGSCCARCRWAPRTAAGSASAPTRVSTTACSTCASRMRR